ncbi:MULTISPECIES: FkbM family methyltransferase [Rhizobium]|uniref:FkbM family methyltransferase n=1 Tax=Rhizobium TaxID=379 RepID=UPI001B319822|nr:MULTISPECIES: FkbM family methyltransferase [Rhizobium]MBX4906696.1 FkbM family methyltransferase [Rhizobium bangladeshense]MBX5213272.1 FkbM family methyltransferase [Rhizobium sp. NLR9a]MBX5219446.1 FkbM family methyltransferase [Rhizobium sp. NLR8a]MBX5224928.1 FkbM family methyltransferase [Rhizobium sp. NLR9b]MBX5230790.1 FkbM family methyltransferase [Rhizobium sp. NLR4a]
MPGKPWLTAKYWSRRLRKARNRTASRFFDTRLGRRLLIENIGPRVVSMTVDAGDHLMTFSPADYIGRKVFRKGHFERDAVDRLIVILRERGLLRKDATLLEIGGNIGTQTVYFALSGTYANIVSVEPDPRNFPLLELNIRQNRLEEKVRLVNCAAGEHAGEIDFFLNLNNHGKSSAIRQSPIDRKISVPVKPVSEILAGLSIDPAAIGLVWMDIEGYEPVACRSMQPLLSRRVPLHMEFTPLFYGREGTKAFIAMLSGFYEDCLVLFEDREEEMKVRDLPEEFDQYNVLFLP